MLEDKIKEKMINELIYFTGITFIIWGQMYLSEYKLTKCLTCFLVSNSVMIYVNLIGFNFNGININILNVIVFSILLLFTIKGLKNKIIYLLKR